MIKGYKSIFIIITGISILVTILFISFLIVQFRLKGGGGYSYYESPEKALQHGLLIRKIAPNINEFPISDSVNLIIENAWLEKHIVLENHIFWIEKNYDPTRYVIKLSYSFRKQSTGEKSHEFDNNAILLETADGINATIKFDSIMCKFIKGDPTEPLSLNIINGNYGRVIKFD